jgi:hypothetical protein
MLATVKFGSVASLLVATFYQGSHDRNHKLWNIVSTERYIFHMQVLLECCYILLFIVYETLTLEEGIVVQTCISGIRLVFRSQLP